MIYVFCGWDAYRGSPLCSIEVISKAEIFLLPKAQWRLIEVPGNIQAQRSFPAVSPINDTEIAILGGYDNGCLGDLIIFQVTTKQWVNVTSGDYKFFADGNQCAQVGHNKMVALV